MAVLNREGRFYFVLFFTFLLFLLINFDRTLGMIFGLMLIGGYFLMITDKSITYRIDRGIDFKKSLIYAIGAYIIFLFVASFSLNSTINSVLGLLSTTTPILQGSKVFTLIGWGIIIPFVETLFFFGPFTEALADRFRVSLRFDLKNIKTWLLFIFVAFIFMFFHLTAKGVTDNITLALTTAFGTMSLWLAAYFRELKSPIMFHMILNTIAIAITLGYILL